MVFVTDKSDLEREFRLAESARELGRRLNALPDKPSVAVYIAGGIAMTYDGPILDMNGLNWTEMAHADRDVRDRYGGFSKPVFYAARPDIVSPRIDGCADTRWDNTPFVVNMLHGLFQGPGIPSALRAGLLGRHILFPTHRTRSLSALEAATYTIEIPCSRCLAAAADTRLQRLGKDTPS